MNVTTEVRYQTAADETAAYDLLEMLLDREGGRAVLATLRAWLMLLEAARNGEKSAERHACINDV